MLEETSKERAQRLAVEDAARVTAARVAVGNEYYGQFTYQPDINERSRWLSKVQISLKYTLVKVRKASHP